MKIYIYLIPSSVAQFPGHDVLHVPLQRRPRTILVQPWTNSTLAFGTGADGGQLWGLVTVAGAAPRVAVRGMELSPIKSAPGYVAERTRAHGSVLENKMIASGAARPVCLSISLIVKRHDTQIEVGNIKEEREKSRSSGMWVRIICAISSLIGRRPSLRPQQVQIAARHFLWSRGPPSFRLATCHALLERLPGPG